MKLSILEQSPISSGQDATDALRRTADLARFAETLGYTRFWTAEHHSTSGLAGSSPEVLISHLASVTETIRVGSGGVLLPQYSPYKVTENFKVLEALFPGRIDLGVGRSPGGGQTIRMALTDGVQKSMNEFPRQLSDMQGFIDGTLPKEHDYASIKASPLTSTLPKTWVLGLSSRGARHAAANSTAFMCGHFIQPDNAEEAMDAYLNNFQPSERQPEPKAAVCVFVICADTEEEAEHLAQTQDMWLLNVEKGRTTKIPTPEEAAAVTLTTEEEKKVQENRKRAVIGTPQQVKKELRRLAELYHTDEIMAITNIFDEEKKKHSFRLLADAFRRDDF
ncbi:LLM class flavin-dependent oxidoreductase [Salibacterium halotolerans]|uniref:Luciferase family oxidoreductase, group 1 n=1 Tax=Salibacterium halotolerans TaxID=1884432 RepID=A0A1I5LHB0_9BACI|nr:LLM class flavin-dependent oxidoreductase [Salibacterium halotolerans]SFO96567.1 luciferase family oxidoreductase, group 1 [Salibacterium halotolerans]